MVELGLAIGLVLVIEGLIYAGFPNAAKRMAVEVLSLPPETLRKYGLVSMFFGVAIVWLLKG